MKYNINFIVKLTFFILPLIVSIILTACSRNIDIALENIENSNLNNRGDNVPVTAIIYKLNDIKKFRDASAFDLLYREDVILGKDKIDSIKMQVSPNEKVAVTTIDKKVAYIGILVIYVNTEGKRIKSYVKVKDIRGIRDTKVSFTIFKEGVYFVE
ncbi:type VI secretion system lipoprotein TssJ [Helicobacter didelphidarum]|nr:type VI secretion system lipoprotein TssJ [Helicobacter didelphidarum]